MTLAGQNIKICWWRITEAADDIAGGAITTGTPMGVYMARMQANPDEQVLVQQGLEVDHTYTVNIVPGTLRIKERDEIEIIAPTDHPYCQMRFRVTGVRYSDLNPRDPRNYMMLMVSKSRRAHSVA